MSQATRQPGENILRAPRHPFCLYRRYQTMFYIFWGYRRIRIGEEFGPRTQTNSPLNQAAERKFQRLSMEETFQTKERSNPLNRISAQIPELTYLLQHPIKVAICEAQDCQVNIAPSGNYPFPPSPPFSLLLSAICSSFSESTKAFSSMAKAGSSLATFSNSSSV